jgi:hypothetical protein
MPLSVCLQHTAINRDELGGRVRQRQAESRGASSVGECIAEMIM